MQKKKVKEVIMIEEQATIGNKASSVTAKVDFNSEKGTVAVTLKMTTKQISFEENEIKEANGIATRVLTEAYQEAQEQIQKWLETNRPGYDPAQGNLFDIIKGGGSKDSDLEDVEEEELEDELSL